MRGHASRPGLGTEAGNAVSNSSVRNPFQVLVRRLPQHFTSHSAFLQRKCACGSTNDLTGECEECRKKKLVGLQTKLRISEPGDRYEQEADRVADAVVAGDDFPKVISSIEGTNIQRQPWIEPEQSDKQRQQEFEPEKNDKEKLLDGLITFGTAFLDTETGKELLESVKDDPLVKQILSSVEKLMEKVSPGGGVGGYSPGITTSPSGFPRGAWALGLTFTEELPNAGGAEPVSRESEKIATETARLVAQERYMSAHTRIEGETPDQIVRMILEANVGRYAGMPLGSFVTQQKTQKTKSGPQLAFPTPSFGYKPKTPLIGESLKLTPPGERKKKKEDETTLQRKADNAPTAYAAPPVVHDVLSSGGKPLDQNTLSFMEARFGHDFSRVRIHTDARAAVSARAMNATAYTVGNNIAFDSGQFAPGTLDGRRLIAHELTHVIQQQAVPNMTTFIMRRGRTFGGFWSNLLHFWDYSKETLDEYLAALDRDNVIQGDDDSDDLARQIVKEWKESKAKYNLSPKLKILLVREMMDGVCSDADQERIIELLEGSINEDLKKMFRTAPNHLTYDELSAKIDKDEHRQRLDLLNTQILTKLETLAPYAKASKTPLEYLRENEKEYGFEFQDLSVQFNLAACTLYEKPKADIVVPDGGAKVTITLTSSDLNIRFEPSLFVDVVWVGEVFGRGNAYIDGISLELAGLKPKIEMHGSSASMEVIQEEAQIWFKGLLVGTRFEDPKYDPTKDPSIIGEVKEQLRDSDSKVLGDIDRVIYNLNKEPSDIENKASAEKVSDFEIGIRLKQQKEKAPKKGKARKKEKDRKKETGRIFESGNFRVRIAPETEFYFHMATRGTGADLKRKELQLVSFSFETDGIVFSWKQYKIATLTYLKIGPDLESKAKIRWFLRPTELAEKMELVKAIEQFADESLPAWMSDWYLFKGFPGDVLGSIEYATETYDEASSAICELGNARDAIFGVLSVDPFSDPDSSPKKAVCESDIQREVADWAANELTGIALGIVLGIYREMIKNELDVSDAQINKFFGLK